MLDEGSVKTEGWHRSCQKTGFNLAGGRHGGVVRNITSCSMEQEVLFCSSAKRADFSIGPTADHDWKGGTIPMDWLMRSRAVLGPQVLQRLQLCRVAVLGLGGVGGAAAEALCRSGVGHLLLVDADHFEGSNLNRQTLSTCQNLGVAKTQAARERLLSIAPDCQIQTAQTFYLPDNREFLFSFRPDVVVDAIDTVIAKLDLAQTCAQRNIPLIACMGTGNRLQPELLQIGDVTDTVGCGCPLAKVYRRELKKRGIVRQTVVFSTELPRSVCVETTEHGRHSPGSVAFVPPVAGYLMASWVVRQFL